MKTELFTLLIFNVWVLPSKESVCTNVGNLSNLTNNYRLAGLLTLTKPVDGFFHCVETCKKEARCKAIKYNPHTNQCRMHQRFKYSKKASDDGYLTSVISDWTKKTTDVTNGEIKGKLRRGYDCYMMIGERAFYNGTTNVTKSGIQCQKWSDMVPQIHTTGRNAKEFTTGETMAEISNRCRVPITDTANKPWCYTVKFGFRLEMCDVPLCPPESG